MSDEDLCCECYGIHEERIAEAVKCLPEDRSATELSDFFKVLGDSTRIRILFSLDKGEMCVCDISTALGMTMSAVSHQLRILRDAHLVNSRKEGRMVFYSLCDEHVKTIIAMALEHVAEDLRGPLRNP